MLNFPLSNYYYYYYYVNLMCWDNKLYFSLMFQWESNKDRNDSTSKSWYSNLNRNKASRKLFVDSWLQLDMKVHATKIEMTLLAKFSIQIFTKTQLLGSYLFTHDSWLQMDMKVRATKIGMTLLAKVAIQICIETQLLGSYFLTHE